jgi:hypothetical protein
MKLFSLTAAALLLAAPVQAQVYDYSNAAPAFEVLPNTPNTWQTPQLCTLALKGSTDTAWTDSKFNGCDRVTVSTAGNTHNIAYRTPTGAVITFVTDRRAAAPGKLSVLGIGLTPAGAEARLETARGECYITYKGSYLPSGKPASADFISCNGVTVQSMNSFVSVAAFMRAEYPLTAIFR